MSARLGQLAKFPINNNDQDWAPESGFQTEILWMHWKSKSTPASEFHFQQQVLGASSWLYQGWVLDPPSLSSLATVFHPRCNCSSRLTCTHLFFNRFGSCSRKNFATAYIFSKLNWAAVLFLSSAHKHGWSLEEIAIGQVASLAGESLILFYVWFIRQHSSLFFTSAQLVSPSGHLSSWTKPI